VSISHTQARLLALVAVAPYTVWRWTLAHRGSISEESYHFLMAAVEMQLLGDTHGSSTDVLATGDAQPEGNTRRD
jgi:hypothetical protein